MAFKTGDVVMLKSGGPKMTVFALNAGISGDEVRCHWFVDGVVKSGNFKQEQLESAN